MASQRAPADVFEAYRALGKRDKRALLGIARHYAKGTGFGEPLELLHEALVRTADGRRVWSARIEFGAHMALCMRSIADGDRKLHGNQFAASESFDELMEWGDEALSPHPSAESLCSDAQNRESARSLVRRARPHWEASGDREALGVVDAMLDDLDNEQIAKRLGLSHSAVRSAKKRVLRKLKNLAGL